MPYLDPNEWARWCRDPDLDWSSVRDRVVAKLHVGRFDYSAANLILRWSDEPKLRLEAEGQKAAALAARRRVMERGKR